MDLLSKIPILNEPNPRLVLRLVREAESVSRADLARATGLHPSTITRLVAALLEAGLLQESGEGQNDLGRKPIVLSVVEDAIHVVGLAVEAGFVSGVLVNLGARILERIDLPFPPAAEQDSVLETIFAVVAGLLSRAQARGLDVAGIGVAMHGTVDSASGISIFAPAIGWRNVAVAELLEERFGLPVRMENNAKAMALGEAWFGNGQGVRHLLAVKVGQAIGSGVILNGELFVGANFSAGEIGHTTVISDGMRCKCGNFGCLETVASIDAVLKKLRVILKRGDGTSSLLAQGDLDPDELTADDVYQAVLAGDGLACQLWDEVAAYLGVALANTMNILNPAKVLIGGDILPIVDYLLPRIREVVVARVFDPLKAALQIEPVGLGENAVAVGAATLVFRELLG